MGKDKIKVVMVVSGFPTEDNPSHSVFNLKAANRLSECVDLVVVQLRYWKPGRKFFAKFSSKYIHYTLSIPYIPFLSSKFLCLSVGLYNRFGLKYLQKDIESADIIHSVSASLSTLVGAKWAERVRKPHLIQLIGSDVNSDLPIILNLKCAKNLKENINAVGCDGKELKERYETIMGKIKHFKVIYRGVNFREYEIDSTYRDDAGNKNKKVFLFIGGVPNYGKIKYNRNLKGGITLMEAWKKNVEELNKLNCKLVFAGPESDSHIVQNWKSNLVHPGSVEIKGKLSPEEIKRLQKECDVALVPSMEEGVPNAVLEAGAFAKCVIASRTGGIPEIIHQPDCGILLEPGNSEMLGEAILSVAKNPSSGKKLGLSLRKFIEANFDSNVYAPSYLSFYNEILENNDTGVSVNAANQ